MIPHTFPTIGDGANDAPVMPIYKIASIVGLSRWSDYIPVKTVTSDFSVHFTTNAGGYQPVYVLASTTGKVAWVDYIPCYEDAAATVPFVCSASGYIPISEDEYYYLLENGTDQFLLEDASGVLKKEY